MYIRLVKKGLVAFVSLNRPEIKNAFDPVMLEQITQVFSQLHLDESIRAVVLDGVGSSFCSGADLNWMKNMVNFSLSENVEDSQKLFSMFEAIRNCSKPIITIVHGHALGGALGLLAASDLVLALPNTKFGFTEVRLGIVPGVISSFVLNRAVPSLARLYMISGELFDENVALQMGLVHQVVTSADLMALLDKWLLRFTENGPGAVASTKMFINNFERSSDFQKIKSETIAAIAERRISAEGQEGLRSFLEKRKPSWHGDWVLGEPNSVSENITLNFSHISKGKANE